MFASRCWARHGLSWPWESLHVEALAWFDHWVKGQDTGILEGSAIHYVTPGADGCRETATWPPIEAKHETWSLSADGGLMQDEREAEIAGDDDARGQA